MDNYVPFNKDIQLNQDPYEETQTDYQSIGGDEIKNAGTNPQPEFLNKFQKHSAQKVSNPTQIYKKLFKNLNQAQPLQLKLCFLSLLFQNTILSVILYELGVTYTDIDYSDRSNYNKRMWWIFFFLVLWFLFSRTTQILFKIVTLNFTSKLRVQVFKSIMRNRIQFFDQQDIVSLKKKFGSDCDEIQIQSVPSILGKLKNFFYFFLFLYSNSKVFVDTAIFALLAFIFFWIISWRLSLIVIFVLPVFIGVILVLKKFGAKEEEGLKTMHQRLVTNTETVIDNITLIKAYVNEEKEGQIFTEEFEQLEKKTLQSALGISLLFQVSDLLIGLFLFMVVFSSGSFIFNFRNSISTRVNFFLFLILAAYKVKGAIGLYKQSVPTLFQLDQVNLNNIDCDIQVLFFLQLYETVDMPIPMDSSRIIPNQSLQGDFVFENVTFAYPKPTDFGSRALDNVGLIIEKSQFTGILGEKAAGKTTLINLIMRFYDLNEGRIMIDNSNLNDLSVDWLRGNIGYVSSNNEILNRGLDQNITLGMPRFYIEVLKQCVNDVGLSEFITDKQRYPDNVRTIIGGKNGTSITALQQIQIALARVLMRNANIIILDDVTKNLDSDSEKIVIDLIRKLFFGKNKTIIMTSRNIRPLLSTDLIVILDQGQVIAQGNHSTLLSENKWYSGKYANQKFSSSQEF